MGGVAGDLIRGFVVLGAVWSGSGGCVEEGGEWSKLTLLRRRFEAIIAISSQIRLLVSKSRVSLG